MSNTNDWLADARVQNLLAEWVERRDDGGEVSAAELCAGDPQLEERLESAIEELKRTDWIVESTGESEYQSSSDSADQYPPFEKLEPVSAEVLLERVTVLELLPKDSVEEVRSQLTDGSGLQAAHVLLESGLTRFQLSRLVQDRGAELLLNDYLMLEPIGAGGMGHVYKALQQTMDRIVAVKVMKQRAFGSTQVIERFRREVRTAAQLTHPHIVTAYDAGEADGRHYLVMEFVDGDDLGTLIRREGPLGVDRAVDFTCQAANALKYAHQQRIIHRDVKPSNLLLDSDGNVKVLDLGLARRETHRTAPASTELTASGQVMGTIDYLAPEQAVDSRQADARSDIYSLGCTLHTLLYGTPLFDGESVVNRILAHQSAEVPALDVGRADVSSDLDRVFRRMVAKCPEDRFQTMDEVICALRSIDNADQATSARVRTDTPSRTDSQTQRAFLWIAAVIGVMLFGAATIHFLTSDSQNMRQPEITPLAARSEQQSPPHGPAPPLAVAPFSVKEAAEHQLAWAAHLGVPVEYENSIGMKFRLIPPGEFVMGSTQEKVDALQAGEASAYVRQSVSSEFPAHIVRISSAFYLAAHETTQAHYLEITGTNPSYFPQDDQQTFKDGRADQLPVDRVSWFDSVSFCNSLSQRDGLESAYELAETDVREINGDGYRLPSEAQWEYAAGGGSAGDYCSSDADRPEQLGWFDVNSEKRTHPVGLLQRNAFGLFDVHGNVGEWCADWYRSDYYRSSPILDPQGPSKGRQGWRILRGGTYRHAASRGRLRTRSYFPPDEAHSWKGCRVMLSVDAVRQMISRQTPPPAVAPFSGERARDLQSRWADHLGVPVDYENSIGMTFRLIPPGEFVMGSTREEIDALLALLEVNNSYGRNDPRHSVTEPTRRILSIRDGSFKHSAARPRFASRATHAPEKSFLFLGFRLLLPVEAVATE